MPCSCRKARLLLKEGKAVIVKRTPFTIQLKFGSSGYRQPIVLGIDTGSKVIGLSASTKKQELFAGECYLRDDIVRLLSTRSELRRTRRSQKTRYRKARFLNRISTKKEGWVAPSINNKIQTHVQVIKNLHNLLPITKLNVEVAAFDIQKIKNPAITGTDYQQGEQKDFFNVREYVLFRDGHKCQGCKGKSGDKILNVHHIESRKTGGDAPGNLITLCSSCHTKHHSGEIELKFKRKPSFKDAAFMGIMKWKLFNQLNLDYPNAALTYGYLTKMKRIEHGLSKSHINDAFCIAENLKANRLPDSYTMRKVRSHDRKLHKTCYAKGGKKIKIRGDYLVHGYRNFDQVEVNNQVGFVTTRRTKGNFVVSDVLKSKIMECSPKKLSFIAHSNNILIQNVRNRN